MSRMRSNPNKNKWFETHPACGALLLSSRQNSCSPVQSILLRQRKILGWPPGSRDVRDHFPPLLQNAGDRPIALTALP